MWILAGATGYIGRAFAEELKRRGIDFCAADRSRVNLSEPTEFARWLRARGATFLINCAGYTGRPNVDACEQNREACWQANAVLPAAICQASESVNVPWGHVSSGCIFTGRRADGRPFRESDPPNFSFRQGNCSFYSGTKAVGEEMLTGGDVYVWRLRIPFNKIDGPRNYLTKVMSYPKLLDVENSLTHLDEFVAACIDCATRRLPFGIYNLTNPGSVTTRQVARSIQAMGLSRRPFSFFCDEEEFMRVAARTPRSSCVLDSSKALAHGLRLSPVSEAIAQSLDQWTSHRQRAAA